MNADWKMANAQYAEFNVPTCAGVDTNVCVCLIQILCPANDLILGPHVTSRLSQLDIGIVCHAWRPCLLNLGFICPLPSVTKSRVFCLGPPYPAEWAAQLSMWDGTVNWNLLCLWGVSPAEKDSLCGIVMMAWIWHVWINAIVFVPTAKAHPKAGAKELSCHTAVWI